MTENSWGGNTTLANVLTRIADGVRKQYNRTDTLTLEQIAELVNPPTSLLIPKGKLILNQGSYLATDGDLGGGWFETTKTTLSNFDQLKALNANNEVTLLIHLWSLRDRVPITWNVSNVISQPALAELKGNSDNLGECKLKANTISQPSDINIQIGFFSGGTKLDLNKSYVEFKL